MTDNEMFDFLIFSSKCSLNSLKMKIKYSDFANICRTCLKIVSSLEKVSIFDCIELEHEYLNSMIEKDEHINIWDIISLCSSKIHVNIHHNQ